MNTLLPLQHVLYDEEIQALDIDLLDLRPKVEAAPNRFHHPARGQIHPDVQVGNARTCDNLSVDRLTCISLIRLALLPTFEPNALQPRTF